MKFEHTHVVILAGGTGTRFWPMSRQSRPKQFLTMGSSDESMIQATARRVQPLLTEGCTWAVTNKIQKPLVEDHIPYAKVLVEPMGRNSAPAIGLAAAHLHKHDPQAVMLVLSADHAVKDEQKLRDTFVQALNVANQSNHLVLIGIQPTYPHTGYGYIKRGDKFGNDAYLVSRFFEKPNYERALEYYQSGEFSWNSGMFACKVQVMLEAMAQYLPETREGLRKIEEAIGTPQEQEVLHRIFPTLEDISIDFGVLEHARNCVLVSGSDFGWNDVGSWDAWAEQFPQDSAGNVLLGDTLVVDSENCIIHSDKKLTAVLGAKDLVIIDSGDALLVCPRDRVQDVKKIVTELQAKGRKELI